MLQYILFGALVVQTALAVKIFLDNPKRKLNRYLSLIPGLFLVSTVIEINLFFTTDETIANRYYAVYQYFAFSPVVLLTLACCEYFSLYSKSVFPKTVTFIKVAVVVCNLAWVAALLLTGPSARIFLTGPGRWTINNYSLTDLFYLHTASSAVWMALTLCGFIYLSLHAIGAKRRRWFGVLSFFQFILVGGILTAIFGPRPGPGNSYDLIACIPGTLVMVLQLWVLSGLSLFDINSGNMYSDMLLFTNEWFVVLDGDSSIQFMNEAILTKSGLRSDRVIHRFLGDIISIKGENGRWISAESLLLHSPGNDFLEIVIQFNKTGVVCNVQSSVRAITLPDGSQATLWVLIDTTQFEALKIQKQLVEEKAIELSKVYGDTLMMMNMTSHDLKTPLTTITELARLIKTELNGEAPDSVREYLGFITSIAGQSLVLAQQMIEFMRIKVVEKEISSIDLRMLMERLKERFIVDIMKLKATIQFSGITHIIADRHHISELLANLIDNSLKYKNEEAPVISIDVSEDDVFYCFKIADNGLGIHQDFIPKAFSAYTRETTISHGSGIGLSICKSIIEANGGKIEVIKNIDRPGITVSFTIKKQPANVAGSVNSA